MLNDQVIIEFAQGVIEGIQNNIRTKRIGKYGPMHDTGAAEESLSYRWDGKRLQIYSSWPYIWVLEDGRKPGKMPPVDSLIGWVERKVQPVDASARTVAFLIARKIGRDGTWLYQQGGKSGILSEFSSREYIIRNLSDKLAADLVKQTLNIIKSAA